MNPNKHGMNNNDPQNTTQIYRLTSRNPIKHGVNNNGPQNTTQIYRLNNRSHNKHEMNNNGPQNTTQVPVAQSVDLCSVLWTIVVHPVFIGVPVAQSVDLWTIIVHPVFIGEQAPQ
jgi:hypothetical protein